MKKLLKEVPEGHLFKLTPEDMAAYNVPVQGEGFVLMKIEHIPGGTNCVITNSGKLAPFMDPDRTVEYLGPVQTT